MSPLTIFAYILTTSTLSGAIGMGGGVILMAVLLTFLPLPEALVLHGIIQASSNGFRALLNYKHIKVQIVLKYILASSITFFLLQYVDYKPSRNVIYMVLGLLPFLTLLKRVSIFFDIEKKGRSFGSGVLVSIGQSISGASGSMLDLFYLSSSLGRFSIVATKAMTQTIGHTFKTIFYLNLFDFNFQQFSNETLGIAILTPLFGGYFGKLVLNKFSDDSFLKVAKMSMLLLSTYLFIQGAMGI